MKQFIFVASCVLVMVFAFGSIASADLNNGLVAYYPFDGNANDVTGNAYNGNVYGAVLGEDRNGKQNSAYSFDGIDDYILLGNIAALKMSNFTLSAWCQTTYTGSQTFYRWWMYGQAWGMSNLKHGIGFHDSTAAYYSAGSVSAVDVSWHFLTVSFDGATLKVYKDGVLENSETVSAQVYYNNTAGASIGKNGNQSYFNGSIDDFRIYNRALSDAEVQELYELEPVEKTDLQWGLVAYYPFNGNAYDESGNGYNGNVYGATLTTDKDGNSDSAYSFDGVNDYIFLGNLAALKTPAFTLSTWCRTSFSGHQMLYRWWHYGQGWAVNTFKHGVFVYDAAANYYSVGSGSTFDEDWHLLTVSFDGATLKVYKDGDLLATKSDTGKIYYSSAQGASIGRNGSQSYFNGDIDDFRIYDRALSDTEVQDLYKQTKITPPSNVVTIAENGKAIIQWNPVATATKYYIYMGYGIGVSKTNHNAKLVATNLNTNLFVWENLSNAQEYFFVVTAAKESQGVEIESDISMEVSVTPVDTLFDVQISDVPFQSQLDALCSPNYLCGYAATTMQTSFLHGNIPSINTVQDMAEYATTYRCPPSESGFEASLSPAQNAGIGDAPDSYYDNTLTFNEIKALLRNNKPVHVGLTYSQLGQYRCNTSWNGGHAVVIVGYSESQDLWYIHDPLCSSGTTGAYKAIPSNIFRAAVLDFCFGIEEIFTIVVQ